MGRFFSSDALGLCLSSSELFSLNAWLQALGFCLFSLDALLFGLKSECRWASAFQQRCAGLYRAAASCSPSMRSASRAASLVQPRCAVVRLKSEEPLGFCFSALMATCLSSGELFSLNALGFQALASACSASMRCCSLEERGAVGLRLFRSDASACLSSGELFSLNAPASRRWASACSAWMCCCSA